MDLRFRKEVNEIIELAHKGEIARLGETNFANRRCVQNTLPPSSSHDSFTAGNMIRNMLREIIVNKLQPGEGENLDRIEWRNYAILSRYILQGKDDGDIAKYLKINKNVLSDEKKRAERELIVALWELEEIASRPVAGLLSNLPKPSYAKYVDRYDEKGVDYVEKIIDDLQTSRAWVISVEGPAGVGKTTVAYEVARRCLERKLFRAVIWYSAKQDETPPDTNIHLPQKEIVTSDFTKLLDAIAKVYGERKVLSFGGPEQKEDIVNKLLRASNALIVIDNLESLSSTELEEVNDFVRHLPDSSKAILTSRIHRGVGAISVELSQMSFTEAKRLLHFESQEKGLRVLTEDEMKKIYEAYHGNPYAMKVAMGLFTKSGNLEQIIELSIQDSSKIVAHMFEGTYFGRWLGDSERRTLHAMTLFVNSASIESLAAATSLGIEQVRASIVNLSQLFLVMAFQGGETKQSQRYEILPAMRSALMDMQQRKELRIGEEYLEKFVYAGHTRLAEFYSRQLEKMLSVDDGKLPFLRFERDNILNLMDWCYSNHEWEAVVKLMLEVGGLLGFTGHNSERELWSQRAIFAAQQLKNTESESWIAVRDLIWIQLRNGQIDEAQKLIKHYLAVARQQGFARVEAFCLGHLGRIADDLGDQDTALDYFQKSYDLWENSNKRKWAAYPLTKMGMIYFKKGNMVKARTQLQKALEIQKKIGHKGEIAQTLSDLALVALGNNDTDDAVRLSRESVSIAIEIQQPAPSYGYALLRRAEIEHKLGKTREAIWSAEDSIRTFEKLGMTPSIEEAQRLIKDFRRS